MRRIIVLILCLSTCLIPAQGMRILFIGDSITDGGWGRSNGEALPSAQRDHHDMNHIYGHSYMYLCAAYYLSTCPEKEYSFYNRGISGDTLEDIGKRWEEDALALNPDIISLLVGTNDVHSYLEKGATEPFDLAGWEKRYRSLLDRALQANPSVRFVLGAPFTAPTGWMKDTSDYELRKSLLQSLSEIVQRIAEDYGATFLAYDRMFARLIEETPTSQETYWIWDGIHPTPAGHARMAALWIEQAGTLLQ